MSTATPRVGPLAPSDLAEVARVHISAFPESELGRMGPEAVRRSYLWQFEGPHDLTALGAWSDGVLVGFLFGGVFRGSTIGFVKRERWFLLGQVLRHRRAQTTAIYAKVDERALRAIARPWPGGAV